MRQAMIKNIEIYIDIYIYILEEIGIITTKKNKKKGRKKRERGKNLMWFVFFIKKSRANFGRHAKLHRLALDY